MHNRVSNKRSAVLTLLVIATAITALGAFVHGRVFPLQPQNEALIKVAVAQYAFAKHRAVEEK